MQRATSHAKIFPEILSEQCAMQEHRIVEEAGRNQMQVQSGTTLYNAIQRYTALYGTTLYSAIQRYTTLYGATQRYATHADAIQTLYRRYADAMQMLYNAIHYTAVQRYPTFSNTMCSSPCRSPPRPSPTPIPTPSP